MTEKGFLIDDSYAGYLTPLGDTDEPLDAVERGGPGSGHFGHKGRPGQVGGSLPGAGMNLSSGKMIGTCPKCGGSGHIDAFQHVAEGVCFACGGTGKVEVKQAKKADSPDEKWVALISPLQNARWSLASELYLPKPGEPISNQTLIDVIAGDSEGKRELERYGLDPETWTGNLRALWLAHKDDWAMAAAVRDGIFERFGHENMPHGLAGGIFWEKEGKQKRLFMDRIMADPEGFVEQDLAQARTRFYAKANAAAGEQQSLDAFFKSWSPTQNVLSTKLQASVGKWGYQFVKGNKLVRVEVPEASEYTQNPKSAERVLDAGRRVLAELGARPMTEVKRNDVAANHYYTVSPLGNNHFAYHQFSLFGWATANGPVSRIEEVRRGDWEWKYAKPYVLNFAKKNSEGEVVERGGPKSGHHGHKGRPGKRGGSLPGNKTPDVETQTKPKPPEAKPPEQHGEVFTYKRMFMGDKAWDWKAAWMNPDAATDDNMRWGLKDIANLRRKLRAGLMNMAKDYWNHPEDFIVYADWLLYMRTQLDSPVGSGYLGYPARRILAVAEQYGPWASKEETKDAFADALAEQFSIVYSDYLKERDKKKGQAASREEYAKSDRWLKPTDDFFSIPRTETYDPVRAGIKAIEDAGFMFPEKFKAAFRSPGKNDGLPIKATSTITRSGCYTSTASGGAVGITFDPRDTYGGPGDVPATIVHEVGHMVHHLGFNWGVSKIVLGFDATKNEPIPKVWLDFHKAVEDSGATARFTGNLSRRPEIFARSFMQYTASKLKANSTRLTGGNKDFVDYMEHEIAKPVIGGELNSNVYFTWDEFGPIEKALDNIFEVGTWRKK